MNLTQLKKNLLHDGFSAIPSLISADDVAKLQNNIYQNIYQCSQDIGCTVSDYLNSVSRWLHPSPITHNLYAFCQSNLQAFVSEFMNEAVDLVKMNVICKSNYAKAAIPCHQDAAYATKDTLYEFSMWLALHDVPLGSGELEFLPKSHLAELCPAVDFWQPHFVDGAYLSFNWDKRAIAVPIQAGDAILFDARIWHRSAENSHGNDRYAIVTRWKRRSIKKFSYQIPSRQVQGFGMWSCGNITATLLKEGLKHYCQLTISDDLNELINSWLSILDNNGELPFGHHPEQCRKALKALQILHLANGLHNGGDAQGVIYANLWHTFLKPLSNWLTQNAG